MTEETEKKGAGGGVSRRNFIISSGAVIVGGAVGAIGLTSCEPRVVEKEVIKEVPQVFPASTAYLVYDSTKCVNCATCMMACSTVHQGVASYSLSRIQMLLNTFGKFPDDLDHFVCRQCATPACVQACPTGACHVDTARGNVRVIDQSKCIGCQSCLKACPFRPHRIIWNADKKVCTKCDLCINTPYWNETGGPDYKQACVEVCPHKAIKLVKEAPPATDNTGYNVDLKSQHYLDIITKTQAVAATDYLKDNPSWWPVK